MSHHPPVPTAPGAVPLFGHLPAFARDPFRFLSALPGRGDIVRLRVGGGSGGDVVMVVEPELTRRVLLDDRTFDKGGLLMERVRGIFGNGLATCPYADHRRQRRLCQSAFGKDRMPGYAAAAVAEAGATVGRWREGRVLDVCHEMMQLLARTVTGTLFASAVPRSELARITADFTVCNGAVLRRTVLPDAVNRLPTPAHRARVRAERRLRSTLARVVLRRRDDPEDHDDLLYSLLHPTDGDGTPREPLEPDELVDEAVTFLFAGTQTTAEALAWALHLLARHPEAEAALHAEVDAVLGGRPPAYADLPALVTTRAVITETLRHRPPAWLLARHLDTDTELGGHRLRAGTTVAYSPYVLHHRPELFPDPERFDPGRWYGTRPDRRHFIPFAGGARKCIGDRLASGQAALILATIAGGWALTDVSDGPVRPALQVTLAPRNLRMRATVRRR